MDHIHGPFSFCQGRFEVFFNPTHPDPITPGRREGGRHCIEAQQWAFNNSFYNNNFEKIFKVSVFMLCKLSRNLFYILTLSLLEMLLYPITFFHIYSQNQHVSTQGILKPEVIKRRKKQNLMNIYMTFLAWLAQFMTNMVLVVLGKYVFGKDQFVYNFFARVTIFFNFNVLPFVYIIMGSADFRRTITSKEYFIFLKLLFEF